ncbi:hypothetical protein Tco_0292158 [Tanacetum coccineum]
MPTEMELTLEQTQKGVSYEVSKDLILQLEILSRRFFLKLNPPDHRSILMDLKVTPTNHGRMTKLYSSLFFIANYFNVGYLKMEVKLKNLKKDASLKLFMSTYQERYEHVRPRSHKFTRWQSLQDGESRLCLVDDLKMFKITFSNSSQDKGTSSSLKSMITTSNHKLMIEVKDYEFKTKEKRSMLDVYSRRRITVTRLKIMKKYDYGHLEEIEVRREDQKLYIFKEGDFKRLRLQDIKYMLLILVQQSLTNLTIDEQYDLNVALHQNRRERLMCADELHKFSDGTLNDVRSALHDIVAGIRMEYLPMRK